MTLAIVGVQVFGLSRGFLRYGERLVGHDAALRVLADLRLRVYGRLEAIAPAGLPLFRRGDLVSRVVDDVDSLQDVVLRVIQPFAVACLVGAGTVAVMWMLLPGAGAVLLVALVVSATAVPWLTGRLARREESKQASARGELGAAVVDLIEGAPELTVMGGTGEQVERITLADRRLRATARQGAGTTGIGLGLTTALAGLASWGALALGVHATHGGHLDGALLAVLALVPLAAFELVAPLPAATQALQRSRTAAGRVFAATDAPAPVDEPDTPLPLPRRGARTAHAAPALGVGRLPRHRPAGPARGGSRPRPGTPGGPGRAERGRQVDAGRRPGALLARRRRRGDPRRRPARPVLLRRRAPGGRAGRAEPAPLRHDPGREPSGGPALGRRRRAGGRAGPGRPGRLARRAARRPGHPGRAGGYPPLGRAAPARRQWRAPSWPTSPSSSSTSRPSTSTPRPPTPSPPTCWPSPRATRPSSSPTACAGLDRVDEIIVLDEGRVVERGTHADLVTAGGRYAGLWWDELMNDRSVAEPRPRLRPRRPSRSVLDEAVLNEGSDTP